MADEQKKTPLVLVLEILNMRRLILAHQLGKCDRKMREKETIDRDAAQLLGDTFKNLYFSEIEEVINGFNKVDTEKFNHILGMENIVVHQNTIIRY